MAASPLRVAEVLDRPVCDEHYRMTLGVDALIDAAPGQFVHICPLFDTVPDGTAARSADAAVASPAMPLLHRAFSLASLSHAQQRTRFDLIYRVVGAGTQWMAGLRDRDRLSVLGPLGNCFPLPKPTQQGWLVAGGVGLPPMLWLAEALASAGIRAVAFSGARSANLLPLSVTDADACATARPALVAEEFSRHQVPAVLATDDGSVGFAGHVGAALAAHYEHAKPRSQDLVVYTCGPDRMMQFVATFCAERGIRCYACVEQAMACGTGMCQSCVVPVRDDEDPDGWRYALCCTEGPVFDTARLDWR